MFVFRLIDIYLPDHIRNKAHKIGQIPCTKETCTENLGNCRACINENMSASKMNRLRQHVIVPVAEPRYNVLLKVRHPYAGSERGTLFVQNGEILCNSGRCQMVDEKCRTCFDAASAGSADQVLDAQYRYKQKNAGAHHFRGGVKVRVIA